jgi:hypothetical protein
MIVARALLHNICLRGSETETIHMSDCFVVGKRQLPSKRLLARNDFRARDLGVVERMLPSQVRAAISTVGLP